MRLPLAPIGCLVLALPFCVPADVRASQTLELKPGDRVAIIGNTYAERLQLYGYLETAMLLAFPEMRLTFRNLAWSGDEIELRPRPLNFGPIEEHLERVEANVVLMFYGANESFEGDKGLDQFRTGLQRFVSKLALRRFSESASVDGPVRLALFSPIPQELRPGAPDPRPRRNRDLAAYRDVMSAVALELEIPFIDIFDRMAQAMEREGPHTPLTINGVHLGERGALISAEATMAALGWPTLAAMGFLDASGERLVPRAEELRQRVLRRNRLFFDRYRAVNGYYIYGDRKEPFGVVNFPAEMARFDELVAELDQRILELAGQIASEGGR